MPRTYLKSADKIKKRRARYEAYVLRDGVVRTRKVKP